ncbi:MAG: GspH/FimT family pseudopilin [Pseudomonadota bacterium]
MNTVGGKQEGLTLLELIVVLAVASILLSVGIPSFRGVIMDNRLSDQSNAFVSSVSAARSAAVRYQRDVTLCPISNYGSALPTCAGGTDWSTGWMVWVDRDRDGIASADEVVLVQEPMHSSLTFQSLNATAIDYDARGFLDAGNNEVLVCDSRSGEEGRLIRINGVGRTEVTRQACP